jgi:hypothetical protein
MCWVWKVCTQKFIGCIYPTAIYNIRLLLMMYGLWIIVGSVYSWEKCYRQHGWADCVASSIISGFRCARKIRIFIASHGDVLEATHQFAVVLVSYAFLCQGWTVIVHVCSSPRIWAHPVYVPNVSLCRVMVFQFTASVPGGEVMTVYPFPQKQL